MTDDEDVQVRVPEGRIDLGIGQPDPTLLPLAEMREAAAERLAREDVRLLAYGAQQGSRGFRNVLAGFLSPRYGTDVDPRQLFITGGASHGLDLVCSALTVPGDVVLVEKPSYFGALRILEDRGLKLVSAPTDEHGLVVDALPELVRRHRPKFLYTIPVFHNPSGVTLPAERREQMVELAASQDFHVVADEVYQLLAYRETPPPPMRGFDRGTNRVISLSAFTKILCPGVRLGWIEAEQGFCEGLAGVGVHFSGGGISPFTCAVVRSAIELGLQEHYLEELKRTFTHRSRILFETLRSGLPDSVTFDEARGGYFIWIRLPAGVCGPALLEAAHENGVGYRGGPLFTCDGGLEEYVRVGFTYYGESKLVEGARRLTEVIAKRL